LVRGTPNAKQVGDKGSDGVIGFVTGKKTRARATVSVRGGKQLTPSMVRDLEGVVAKTKGAEMGILVTLHPSTKGMRDAAATGGTYRDWVGASAGMSSSSSIPNGHLDAPSVLDGAEHRRLVVPPDPPCRPSMTPLWPGMTSH
jgi:hypothetical protein